MTRFEVSIFVACAAVAAACSTNDGANERAGESSSDAASSEANPPPRDEESRCDREPIGPRTTADRPVDSSPWTLEASPFVGVDSPIGDAGSSSGCLQVDSTSPPDLRCSGIAEANVASGGPELRFADGSILKWMRTGSSVAPPEVADGDRMWVDYQREEWSVCPFCGSSYYEENVTIRAEDGGSILWVAREGQGPRLPVEGDDSIVGEVLGVGTERRRVDCVSSYEAACYDVTRVVFDHVLLTVEPQIIAYGEVTRVETPSGIFDVLWNRSSDQSALRGGCYDGPAVVSANGFAVSRIQNK